MAMRVAVYARVSTERQGRDQTIDSQLEALRGWAAMKGHELKREHIFTDEGSRAVWTNAEGWYLTVSGAGAVSPGDPTPDPSDVIDATIRIDRVVGSHHWSALADQDCTTILEKADATGLRGSASCQGMIWEDFILSGSDLDPALSPVPCRGFTTRVTYGVDITFDAQ